MKAWHFVNETLRDGNPIPPDGEWLVHEGELKMCESGLHASRRLIDALNYAPGDIICQVEVDGKIIEGKDKLVAEKRKILWRIDGTNVLRAFARWCALQVVDQWDAHEVVVRYLIYGNLEDREAARYAAWSAARYATRSAARYAARDAARDADRDTQNKQLEIMVLEARNGKTKWTFEEGEE